MPSTRVLIMGAAGRDFHNFNTVFRNNPKYQVVAFTATQIPNIDGRKYPAALASSRSVTARWASSSLRFGDRPESAEAVAYTQAALYWCLLPGRSLARRLILNGSHE